MTKAETQAERRALSARLALGALEAPPLTRQAADKAVSRALRHAWRAAGTFQPTRW